MQAVAPLQPTQDRSAAAATVACMQQVWAARRKGESSDCPTQSLGLCQHAPAFVCRAALPVYRQAMYRLRIDSQYRLARYCSR